MTTKLEAVLESLEQKHIVPEITEEEGMTTLEFKTKTGTRYALEFFDPDLVKSGYIYQKGWEGKVFLGRSEYLCKRMPPVRFWTMEKWLGVEDLFHVGKKTGSYESGEGK